MCAQYSEIGKCKLLALHTNSLRNILLQKSSSAGLGTALAVDLLSLDLVDYVSIIPTELLSGGNVALRKKGDPRETEVVGVDEAVLNEDVGSA